MIILVFMKALRRAGKGILVKYSTMVPLAIDSFRKENSFLAKGSEIKKKPYCITSNEGVAQNNRTVGLFPSPFWPWLMISSLIPVY